MWTLNWAYRQAASVLAQGPVPQHIAFIMDGNRRYARAQHKSTIRGHEQGYGKLKEALQWCLAMGIQDVTVFAFSIENFSRSREEVESLMELAADKFAEMLDNGDIIDKHNARVRILGSAELLPARVREVMGRVVEVSRHNTRVNLNICFSYSHEQEMRDAMLSVRKGVDDGRLLPCDVNTDLLQACTYTGARPVDMLVRTSGEARLSDFLLYQSSNAYIRFLDSYWPDLAFWRFGLLILAYQRAHTQLRQRRERLRAFDAREQQARDLAYLKQQDVRRSMARRPRLQSTDESSESKTCSNSSSSSSSSSFSSSSSDELGDSPFLEHQSTFSTSSSSSSTRVADRALRMRKRKLASLMHAKPSKALLLSPSSSSSSAALLPPAKDKVAPEMQDRLDILASERQVRVSEFLASRTRTGIMD
jgi:ditrans,polycis-polyprenyl diphosphate synthase